MILVCDNEQCKKEYELDTNALKERDLGSGIKQIYFNCPHCNYEYPVTKVSKDIEELQEKINYYSDRATKIKNDPAKKSKLLERMQVCIEEKKIRMELLNKKDDN